MTGEIEIKNNKNEIQNLQDLLSHHHAEIKRLKASREEYAQENIELLTKESDKFKAKLDALFL